MFFLLVVFTKQQGPLSSLSDPLSGSGEPEAPQPRHVPPVHTRVLFEMTQPQQAVGTAGGVAGIGGGDQTNDVDDDLLTLLSSISLSETRKNYYKKQNPQKINVPVVPSYRLLVVDDSGLLCIALRTDNHICDEVRQQPYQGIPFTIQRVGVTIHFIFPATI